MEKHSSTYFKDKMSTSNLQGSQSSQTAFSKDEQTPPEASSEKGTRFNPGYVTTVPGIVKLLQAVISLIGFVCVQTIRYSVYKSAGGWFSCVSLPAFFISTIFLFCYVFHVVERFKELPWLCTEMGYAAIWCLLFFIASTVAATRVRADPPWGAATFFGFLSMGLFGYEALKKYRSWVNNEPAQGTRSVADVGTGTDPNASF